MPIVPTAALMISLLGFGPGAPQPPQPAPAPAPVAPATTTTKAEARERFDRGLGLFEKADYAAALAEFKRAYELIPNPVVLYNMGLVYAAMNRPVEATDALDRFLTQAGDKAAPEPRRQARKVRDEQAARIARVMVLVDQPAVVEIDGIEAGRTPLGEPLRVQSGAHTIAALAPGYQPARRELTLAGQVTETITFKLLPTETGTAHLALVAPVPGAEVWIDDRRVGVTPLAADVAVAPGPARIELRRAGYKTASRSLRLDPGATARLDIALEEDPAAPVTLRGRLHLRLSDPGTTDLTIDETPRAFSPDGLVLPGGPHVVRVRRSGFEPYQAVVDVAAGGDTSLAVTMSPTPETRARGEDAYSARGTLGWSLLGGGAALTVAGALYALVTRHDVGDAQAALAKRQGLETMNVASNYCYLGPNPMYPGYYDAMGCGAVKAGLQDDVDAARLKRVLAFSGVGVGLVAAGVGAYFLTTRERARASVISDGGAEGPVFGLAFDRGSAAATVTGRF